MKNRIKESFDIIAESYDKYMKQIKHYQAEEKIAISLMGKIKGRVLDVACGTGTIINFFDGVGIDISENMVASAKMKNFGIEFLVGDAGNLPFRNSIFDVTICCLALAWFADQRKSLEEMIRVCSKEIIIVEEDDMPAKGIGKNFDYLKLKEAFIALKRYKRKIGIEKIEKILNRSSLVESVVTIIGEHKLIAWSIKKKILE